MRPLLNLASRPLRNERASTLITVVAGLALLLVTGFHARALVDLRPSRMGQLEREVHGDEEKLDALREEGRELGGLRADPKAVERWKSVAALVDSRSFSWTGLLGRLEQLVPAGVRLRSIAPTPASGVVHITLDGDARTAGDALAFVEALLRAEGFTEVRLDSLDLTDGGLTAFTCTADYQLADGARSGEERGAGR